jgi:hypothetical protein
MSQSIGAPAPATQSPIEACKAVFGEYPQCVISSIDKFSEVLLWIGALFQALDLMDTDSSEYPPYSSNISRMGMHLAGEYYVRLQEYLDEKRDHLKAAEAREGGAQ